MFGPSGTKRNTHATTARTRRPTRRAVSGVLANAATASLISASSIMPRGIVFEALDGPNQGRVKNKQTT
jgi:hypothetical protein